jgi:hypothetical protein
LSNASTLLDWRWTAIEARLPIVAPWADAATRRLHDQQHWRAAVAVWSFDWEDFGHIDLPGSISPS